MKTQKVSLKINLLLLGLLAAVGLFAGFTLIGTVNAQAYCQAPNGASIQCFQPISTSSYYQSITTGVETNTLSGIGLASDIGNILLDVGIGVIILFIALYILRQIREIFNK